MEHLLLSAVFSHLFLEDSRLPFIVGLILVYILLLL